MEEHLMYYGLTHNPFDKASENIVETVDYKELSFRLKYLTETLGIGLVTGRPGVGKTVILRDFVNHLDANRYAISYLPLSTVSVQDFYSQLAISIGIEPAFRKSAQFRQLQERITEMHDIEHLTPVFIIDEAQYLNGKIFNELMLITNFGMDAQKKCVVILSGLPEVAQRLQRPQFEAFRQRITVSYQVVGLEPDEATQYIRTKFLAAGVEGSIINSDAENTLVNKSNGSIRRLDLIMTECFIIGAQSKKSVIDNEVVFTAVNELSLT